LSERDKEHFKARVVSSARRLFLANGVEETSMASLGKELGVSKPTLYEAFESKQALVDAVFLSATRDVELGWLTRALGAPPSFQEFLHQMGENYKNFLRFAPSTEAFQLVIGEATRSKALSESYVRHLAGPSGAALRKIVADAIGRGECKPMPLEVAQKMLLAPMLFLMTDRAINRENALSLESELEYVDNAIAALAAHLCTSSVFKAEAGEGRSADRSASAAE
jgi:AcrR family transcriptional regulator